MQRIILLFLFSPCLYAACDQTLTSGANLYDAINAATSGTTICLQAGNYPGFVATTPLQKTAMTTVTTAAGVTSSQVVIGSSSGGLDVRNSSYLAFVGMTIHGMAISWPNNWNAHNILVKNNTFLSSGVDIWTPENDALNVTIDGNYFGDLPQGSTEGRVGVKGSSNTVANGVVIQNNVFDGYGPSDGIQITGSARGTQIIGNVFKNILQAGCDANTPAPHPHCDPIQFYGASDNVVSGNFFIGNDTGVMSPDGNGSPTVYSQNVFHTNGNYPNQLTFGYTNGDTIEHNTFANGAKIRCGAAQSGNCSNMLVRNNVITGGFDLQNGQTMASIGTVDYNLVPSAFGTHDIQAQPTYSVTPQVVYNDFKLSSLSAGFLAGSDGLSMGIYTVDPPIVQSTNVHLENPYQPTVQQMDSLYLTQAPNVNDDKSFEWAMNGFASSSLLNRDLTYSATRSKITKALLIQLDTDLHQAGLTETQKESYLNPYFTGWY